MNSSLHWNIKISSDWFNKDFEIPLASEPKTIALGWLKTIWSKGFAVLKELKHKFRNYVFSFSNVANKELTSINFIPTNPPDDILITLSLILAQLSLVK